MKNKKLYTEAMQLLHRTKLTPEEIAKKIKVSHRWVRFLKNDADPKNKGKPKKIPNPGVHTIQALRDLLVKERK